MNPPDSAPIVDLIEAFRHSKAMFSTVKLGVFDALAQSSEDAATLAAATGANESGLVRLLEACAGLGLIEIERGRYSNTALAQTYLTTASPQSLAGYILYSNDALYPMWSHLEDAVKEASPRWEQTFGWQAPIFEHFFSTPEKMRTFAMGMHGFGVATSPAVVRAFDLSRFRTLCDLGGATGHLAIAACQAWPLLQGIVFDLPAVIPLAEEQIGNAGLAARIRTVPGDFFADDLPEADLYALGRILHDWDESKVRLLLDRIFEALPVGGALLIAEKLLDEDRRGPVSAHMQSLNMLVCTEGRERSLSEYEQLLRSAGLSQIQGRRTGKYLDAILAVKD